MTRDESKPARTSHGQPVTQYQYARLLDAAARLAGEAERAEAENEWLRALLREARDTLWHQNALPHVLTTCIGCRLEERIDAALAGEKAPAEAPAGERCPSTLHFPDAAIRCSQIAGHPGACSYV
jgi:hypothetical protein